MNLKNKKVAVLGLGMEGKDLVSYLLKQKAEITILDQQPKGELDLPCPQSLRSSVAGGSGISKNQVSFVCGKNYLQNLDKYEIIFRSPGIYRLHPEIVRAEKKGIEISSAIKLFFDLCPARIIGVTGTKGKGTTSTLIYRILKESGKNTHLAGNIGKPILGLLPALKSTSWVVLELSSFQLFDLYKSPHIAVVLNITLDHMDWHKNKKEYVDAKKSIVSYQKENNYGVINYDFNSSKSFSGLTKGKAFYFSKSKKVKGCYVRNGKILLSIDPETIEIGEVKELLLRGEHNWENVTAAICAARLAGASIQSIKQAVFSFKGLEHRLELVKEVDGVKFYNDSFSTGPQPTIAAVKSFSEPTTLILGGFEKNFKYGSVVKEITRAGNIENIILIGDIRARMKKKLIKGGYSGKMTDMGKSSIGSIVKKKSLAITPKGGVVLLSPATSSFDMFENYKDRGNKFKSAVKLLKKR